RAWYNLGLAHKALQQPDLALDAFARSIELNKTFADARVQHIGLLLASGRTGEAKTGVMLLRKCQPEHPDLPALDDALQRRSTPA
ncbi:MAG TPA: tetratricopeptide repeat protein, partial [Deferrisomatales bacterium]|nr:tetratricopeptide repeat protein [Deferrisomatales bacterium]